ncbi:kinesin motor domain-containing protein [Pycnococcus provasolii]
MASTPQGAPSRKCTSAKGARSPSTVLAATMYDGGATPPPSPSASSSSPAVSSASATTTTNGKYRSSASTPNSSSSSSSTHHSARSNKTPGSNTAAGSAAKYRKQQQQQQQNQSPTPPTTKKNKLKLDEQQKKDDNDKNQIEENDGDDDGSSEDNRVRIFVRFRPPRDDDAKKQQQQSSSSSCWTIQQDQYVLSADRDEPFAYDRVFASDTDQCTVFEGTVAEDVRACLQSGVNVTLFAYGQTGSGKTYTVLGTPSSKTAPGLLPRCLDAFFAAAEDGGGSSTSGEVGVHISMYEIYRETIIDLLCTSTTTSASSSSSPAPATLNLQEDNDGNVEVVGLSTELARSKAEALDIVERAGSRRATATTACNVASSRSHLVVVMRRGDGETRGGSLTLCDLAGSERVDKTGAEGTVLKEAQHINSSLSTLGNVVHSLASQKKQHVPYRSSRLTHALKQSLGGRSRTRIVVCVSPDVEDVEETMSSLRFAARAKHMARHAPKEEMEGFSPKPGSPEELIWLRKQRQTLVDEVHTLRERVEAVQGGFGGKTTMPLLMEIVLNAAVLVGAACVLGRTK